MAGLAAARHVEREGVFLGRTTSLRVLSGFGKNHEVYIFGEAERFDPLCDPSAENPVAVLPAFAGGLISDDATLLELGKQFEAAWARENVAFSLIPDTNDDAAVAAAEFADEAQQRTSEIVGAIIEAKAMTFEGLKVKARALSWCQCGEFGGLAETSTNAWWDDDGNVVKDDPTTDILVADSILFDLIALADMDREARA